MEGQRLIKEKEPAPTAIGTSSKNVLQIDDSTLCAVCQEAEKAGKACELILDIYERMEDKEQRAFDLGQAFQATVELKEELARLGQGGGESE